MKTIVIVAGIVLAGATIIGVMMNERNESAQPAVSTQGIPSMPADAMGEAPKTNPAHGMPHHRCDLAVGAPLTDANGAAVPVAVPQTAAPQMPAPAGLKVNPAHGQTGYLLDADYSVERQAQRMIDLLDYLGIDQVNLLGNSMGGFISICMAHKWANRIASLGLLNSAGLKPRTHSELEAAFHGGKNPFIIKSVSDFNNLLSLATSKQQWMPYSVRLMLAKQLADRRERLFRLSLQVMQEISEFNCIEKSKDAFKMPTLVIWGEEDKLLDVDMLDHFIELIPHAHFVKLPNIGHMPMLECPKIAAQHYKKFTDTLFATKS